MIRLAPHGPQRPHAFDKAPADVRAHPIRGAVTNLGCARRAVASLSTRRARRIFCPKNDYRTVLDKDNNEHRLKFSPCVTPKQEGGGPADEAIERVKGGAGGKQEHIQAEARGFGCGVTGPAHALPFWISFPRPALTMRRARPCDRLPAGARQRLWRRPI